MPTVTRLMSIQCEGNRGELLKITTKHTILTEADNASFDSSKVPDGTAYTLPPANGLVPLQLQVRVDRKLLSADELGNSCLLAAIVSFLNTYALKLCIKTVLAAEQDRGLVEGDSDLRTSNFGRTAVNRLQSLVLALHFQTPSNELSTLSLRDALLSNKLDPSLSSLVFRTMLKSISRIVIKYPLVFDACWLQYLQNQSFFLPDIAKSLQRLSTKCENANKSRILHQCLKRVDTSLRAVGSSDVSPSPTVADSEVADLSQTSLKTTQIVPRNAYGNAFFTLLIRATKPKHATTKLLPTPSVAHATEECDLPCAVVTSADSRDGLDHMDPAELKLMQDNEKPAKQNPNSKTPRDELRAVADSFSFEHIPYTWDHPVFPQVEGFVPDATLPDCIPYPLLSLLGRVPAEYTTVDLDKKSSSERPEWTESSRLEGKPAFMTLEDFRRAVHQLECETDHSMIGSQDFAAETFLDPAYHDHSVLDRNAAFVDSQEEFPADLCFSEWDEQYLDGIDARLADLAEQANLHSIDQAIMSLHRM